MIAYTRREVLKASAAIAALTLPRAKLRAAPTAVTKKTVAYASRDGQELLADLFIPDNAVPGPLPAILFVHGGGWAAGTRATGPDFSRYFASAGFVMVAIDYRLTPAIRFPSNLEDVKTAIRWLRANAADYGVDPRRIGLWGTSAGGYLAAMAALTPQGQFEGADHPEQSSAVACVLDGYGPALFTAMDRQTEAERATLQPVAPGLLRAPPMVAGTLVAGPAGASAPPMGLPAMPPHDAADSAESKLMGAPIQSIPDRVVKASPLSYASSDAPPFLLMHGLADNTVPHGQSVSLYEALTRVGAEVTLRLVEGLPHTFFNRSDLDDLAGPYRMQVREHPRHGKERAGVERARVFDVARDFFKRHLS